MATPPAKKVLVVEDNELNMKLFHDLLDAHGYNILQTKDGMEALDIAREHHPDLILMDIVMPGMNGYQATRTLTNDPSTSAIPIVMVTSKGQETDKIWGLRQGAIDYMVKPVSPSDLVAKAQSTLAA